MRDIFPATPIAKLEKSHSLDEKIFDMGIVSAVVGMSPSYIRKVSNLKNGHLSIKDLYLLLELDAFSETFVPRSKIPTFLATLFLKDEDGDLLEWWSDGDSKLIHGSATDIIPKLEKGSVQCVVTSTPYWGTRIYEKSIEVEWADGEVCSYGHEQTPEGFIRHSVELLFLLIPIMKETGSVWWNVMDTYNTRTQIRSNAAETLRAMQGKDGRGWKDHQMRRYSAGHSFLKDGEQCHIPERIAERASRIGYWVKSKITWKKNGSMPETVASRVTREMEHIIHLSLDRAPYFAKDEYLKLDPELGGKNERFESDKITDVWTLPTSSGRDGHGAQFPLALPGRCISLTTQEGDLVLDPFIGSGTTALAATRLNRRWIGIDVNDGYLKTAKSRLQKVKGDPSLF